MIPDWYRLRPVSLFSVVRRAKRETRKWPRARLMARDGRGTKKESLSFSSRAAALVSLVSRLRRSRARALPLLNWKKKRDCSQSKTGSVGKLHVLTTLKYSSFWCYKLKRNKKY